MESVWNRIFCRYIFDAFAQEDDRNTTLSGGTGLGLTISKNIIDFMAVRLMCTVRRKRLRVCRDGSIKDCKRGQTEDRADDLSGI